MGNQPVTPDLMRQMVSETLRQWSVPPGVHFERHRVTPPGEYYITQDDFLRVDIFTTVATTNLKLGLRLMATDGQIHYESEILDGVAVNTLTTKLFGLSEGFIISVVVSNIGGGLADQTCFVSLSLVRSSQSGVAPHTLLAEGYVSNLLSVQWPFTSPTSGANVALRPPAFGTLGAYSKGLTTGQIVATGAANAVIWLMRWTDATRFCLVERIRVNAVVGATITTAVPYNLALFFATSFTASPTTNIGTTGTLTGRNAKRRTSFGTSILGGMWTLGTAAAGMTGQTMTADTDALAIVAGATGTAIGNQFFGTGTPPSLWDADPSSRHPLILATNEGLSIQAPLAGPATGTFQVAVSVDWMEVPSY